MLWERCWDLQKTEHKATRHISDIWKLSVKPYQHAGKEGLATEPTQTTGETRDGRLRGFGSMWRGKMKATGARKNDREKKYEWKRGEKGLGFVIQTVWRWLRGGESAEMWYKHAAEQTVHSHIREELHPSLPGSPALRGTGYYISTTRWRSLWIALIEMR